MLCALIMAGGKGSRFWPLSTEEKPKQFLRLISEDTMLQMTVNRIKEIIPMERIFICTGERYIGLVKEQLPELNEINIIIEPEGKNTAPCITLSAMYINRYYNNATMLVLPSDHLVSNEENFREKILDAYKFIEGSENSIITFGMKPNRAETGYGYIKYGYLNTIISNSNIVKVDKFVEKPNIEKAQKYLDEGCYLWNCGMFLWRCDFILEEVRKYSPIIYEALHSIAEVSEEELQGCINSNYCNTEAISIDYAVLEKSRNVYVIPCDFGWDDVGSWESFERYRERDDRGNINIGNIKNYGADNLIVAENLSVIVDKLSGIYIIEKDGNIFVGLRNNIKQLRNRLDC